MRVKLISKKESSKGHELLDMDLALLVLFHCYGPLGHSIKNAPLDCMDLTLDGKVMPWPDSIAEVF